MSVNAYKRLVLLEIPQKGHAALAMGCGGSTAVDANEAMASVTQEAPEIVIAGEEFLFAFAWSRDQIYFTNQRVLDPRTKPRTLPLASFPHLF